MSNQKYEYDISYKKGSLEYKKELRKQYLQKTREERSDSYRKWYKENGRKRNKDYNKKTIEWSNNNIEKRHAIANIRDLLKRNNILNPKKCFHCGKARKLLKHNGQGYIKNRPHSETPLRSRLTRYSGRGKTQRLNFLTMKNMKVLIYYP